MLMSVVLVEIDGRLHAPLISSTLSELVGIAIANGHTILLSHQIGIMSRDGFNAVPEFIYAWHIVFESDGGIGDIRGIDIQQSLCVFGGGFSDFYQFSDAFGYPI